MLPGLRYKRKLSQELPTLAAPGRDRPGKLRMPGWAQSGAGPA